MQISKADAKNRPHVGDVWMVEPISAAHAQWPVRVEVLDVNRIKVAVEVSSLDMRTMRTIFRIPAWRKFTGSERAYFIEAKS